MECEFSISGLGKNRVLCFECGECDRGSSLLDERCLRSALYAVDEKGDFEEIQFRRKNHTFFHDRCDANMLSEVSCVARDLASARPWLGVGSADNEWIRFIRDVIDEIGENPFRAYDMLSSVLGQHMRKEQKTPAYKEYLRVLKRISDRLESTQLIESYLPSKEKRDIFLGCKKPAFMQSSLKIEIHPESLLLESYRVEGVDVSIYELDGVERTYMLEPPEFFLPDEDISSIMELKDRIAEEHALDFIDPKDARGCFKDLALRLLLERKNAPCLDELSEVFARYTAGYGLLEPLFRDERIHDIYIDSPAGINPVYIDHDTYGMCNTNLYMSEEELERISSKFRAIGGRPFDEANPIMDMELKELGIRVAGIREPATFDGIAYSFRKRRERPWTLPALVACGMLSAKSAALLSLIVSGQQSILITGARGSGKTSLLSSLVAEIRQSDRIVLMEDTPEIPSESLRALGWRIEHLRNQAPISRKNELSYELSPEENLRAALRLGESVLILGEVRGPEAKALFEAMRVGAAGNTVLGTIHGSSPYDTWDRVTNDLGIPKTSFKAVDIVVSVRYREGRESSGKSRYLSRITEVGKEWVDNPLEEGAFKDIMAYEPGIESETYCFEGSKALSDIAARKGMGLDECLENLELREKMISEIVASSEKHPEVLEIKHNAKARKEYIRLMVREGSKGRIDYGQVYSKWLAWLSSDLGGMEG